MICCQCHPKEASCKKKREKVTEAFLRLALPPLKVDADAADTADDAAADADDDGRVGI